MLFVALRSFLVLRSSYEGGSEDGTGYDARLFARKATLPRAGGMGQRKVPKGSSDHPWSLFPVSGRV